LWRKPLAYSSFAARTSSKIASPGIGQHRRRRSDSPTRVRTRHA
jgi:hypothetical protein